MDLLNDWFPESILYATGWTLVHSLWQLILISASFWLLLKIFGKHSTAFKYNLGLAALGLTLVTAIVTFIYELSIFSPAPLFDRLNMAFVSTQNLEASSSNGMEGFINQLIGWIELQLPLLVNFWFLGALLFLFRLFNSLSEIRTLRKSSSDPQDFQLEKMLYRLMGKMNVSKNVEIRLTSYGVSPVTFGYLKPIILIPAGLIFQLTPIQLEAIIAHELAHVKRNDYLINLFQSSLEVLFFYHPCYWWMNQTVKELRENAADDLAVQVGVVPKELAYSLAEVLNFAQQNPPELAMAAGKRRNPTLQRIKRILGHPAQTYPQNPIISIPMLLTLLLSAGLMATAQQDVSVTLEETTPISIDVNEAFEAINNIDFDVNQEVEVLSDTIIENEVSKVIVTDGKPAYVNSKNQVVEYQYAKPLHIQIKGDTIITKGDTVFIKKSKKGSYVYKQNGEMLILEDIPALELTPMPPFPAEAMAPVADFAFAAVPDMNFEMAPVPDFDMSSMPTMVFETADYPMIFEGKNGPGVFYNVDTIKNMTPEQKAKAAKNLEALSEEWAKVAEIKAKEWAANQEEFGAKMEAWQKAMEPKMKEFEKKMEAWQKANEPKMKEFEAKMKAWQESNEPKMKEYEAKMKAWEKEMQPKMEEYQRKMEVWQKENAAKIEAYQKKLEEQLKKKDDNK